MLFFDYGVWVFGDFFLLVLKCDFVSNGGRVDGVDKCGFFSGYKNIIIVRIWK